MQSTKVTADNAYVIQRVIWKHLRKIDGYQPFGYDWPTLRLVRPQTARVLADCYRMLGWMQSA